MEQPTKESLREIKRLERRIKNLQNWEKPNQINEEAEILESALYMYGTDFMNTREIKDDYMGSRYPDMTVTWLNDSSCVLSFPDKDQAAQAFHAFTVENQEQPKAEGLEEKEDAANAVTLDARNFDPA